MQTTEFSRDGLVVLLQKKNGHLYPVLHMDNFAVSQHFFGVMHLTRDVLADTVKVLEITPRSRLSSRENGLHCWSRSLATNCTGSLLMGE